MTEVLSYKLDYRSDLKTIISDIEHEYAMLSTSFLKDTYLCMRQGTGDNNPLIWWQIFKSCYADIMTAARQIIDRPKRRLRSVESGAHGIYSKRTGKRIPDAQGQSCTSIPY